MKVKAMECSYLFLCLYVKCLRLFFYPNLTLHTLSSQLYIHETSLSKLENGKWATKSNIAILLKFYNLSTIKEKKGQAFCTVTNDSLLFDDNRLKEIICNKTEEIINDFFNINKSVNKEILIQPDSIYLPLNVIHFYILELSKETTDKRTKNINKIEKILLNIKNQLFGDLKFICLLGLSYSYYKNGDYYASLELINEVLVDDTLDLRLEIIAHYYLLQVSNCIEDFVTSIETTSKLKSLLKNYPNDYKLLQLQGQIANTYLLFGDLKRSHDYLILGLELSKKISKNQFSIFAYNIGWNLNLQKKYEEAIKYYSLSAEVYIDTATCFEIAWCYFCLNNKDGAIKYIKISRDKTTASYKSYMPLFCDWLDAMINKPYSKKCLKILFKLEKKYIKSMHPESKRFLYSLLSKHLSNIGDYKQALEYSLMIIDT